MKHAKLLARKTLAKHLGSNEDYLLAQIEQLNLSPEQKEMVVANNLPIDTGLTQLVSLITFALEAYEAVFETTNGTFVYQDTANGYVTKHYIAFNDMVMLHNDAAILPDVVRIIPKIFIARIKGDIVCLKHRLNLSPIAQA